MKAKKINILQNDYIDSTEIQDGKVTTRSGNSVSADLLVRLAHKYIVWFTDFS